MRFYARRLALGQPEARPTEWGWGVLGLWVPCGPVVGHGRVVVGEHRAIKQVICTSNRFYAVNFGLGLGLGLVGGVPVEEAAAAHKKDAGCGELSNCLCFSRIGPVVPEWGYFWW